MAPKGSAFPFTLALLLLTLVGIATAVAWLILYSRPTTETRFVTQAPVASESRPVTVIAGGEIKSVYPSFEPRQVDVMDGDTIRADGRVYRLVGFDTPENGSNARCETERALAERARSRLRQIVAKRRGLRLQRVACACRTGTEGAQSCNNGRLCGLLTAAGRDVGAILISENLARSYLCGKDTCPKRQSWC
jgi:endonuclease YncB( thermonuclease family)